MTTWFAHSPSRDDDRVVADYMARLARTATPHAPRVPDAAVVWIRAEISRRWEAERKVQAPLDLMEPLQIAGGLAAAAVLLAWSVPSLLRLVGA